MVAWWGTPPWMWTLPVGTESAACNVDTPNVVPHHATISDWIIVKIWRNIARGLITGSYDFYLYWNQFGDIVEVRMLQSFGGRIVIGGDRFGLDVVSI